MSKKNPNNLTSEDVIPRGIPGQSVAAAFGIGLAPGIIVGLLLRERDKNRLEGVERSKSEPTADVASHYPVDSSKINDYTIARIEELLNLIGGMPSFEEQIKGLFIGLPDGFAALQAELTKLNHIYRQQLAEQLAPSLNAHIRGMEHDTLDQKKELARWVNDQLEPLGLAVQCPNTGRPAKLKGTTGSWIDVGRFCFETYNDGKREKSAYSDDLPALTLIDSTPSQEPETPWQDKIVPKSTRRGRKLP